MAKVSILGTGGFGVSLAATCFKYGHQVTLWGLFPDEVNAIIRDGEHKKLLPGVPVNPGIRVTADIGEAAGADLIHIETMSDMYEMKAAVLGAKEHTSLPVFVTMIFDEKGKLLTGGDVAAAVSMLEGLRVDALGINCGLGPEQMLPILEDIMKYTSLPVIVKPNAGLPRQRDGRTVYDVAPEEFASSMKKIVEMGACAVGGCCGTTPAHIREMTRLCRGMEVKSPVRKSHTIVSSYGRAVLLGDKPVIIGERINPTGKKKFRQALKDHDMEYIMKEAVTQQEKGAHILDVNVGLPDIDEKSMMQDVVGELQSITSLPLQIDTVDPQAMEAAMRMYNGKPMINSVNGKQESMDQVFPLVKKYGGVVVGLTLDEEGIPSDAEGRARIAGRIIEEAGKYGIEKIDVIQFDSDIKGEPLSLKRAMKEVAVLGRAGTNYQAVMDYACQDGDYDGLIICTDGFAALPRLKKNIRTKILWVFNNRAFFERHGWVSSFPNSRSCFLDGV